MDVQPESATVDLKGCCYSSDALSAAAARFFHTLSPPLGSDVLAIFTSLLGSNEVR